LKIITTVLSIILTLGILILNSLSPYGTDYKLLCGIIVTFLFLIVITYLKGPKNRPSFILLIFLFVLLIFTANFQYKSEKMANYTGEEKWKEEQEYQVYRLDDLFTEKTIQNLSKNEIKTLFGSPDKIENKDGEDRYMYVYEGVWGWHQWTEQLYIYFDKNEKSTDYRRETADVVEDINNLKSPQY
jgi:energy-coupling factor transporter transmembrane protein EcfT